MVKTRESPLARTPSIAARASRKGVPSGATYLRRFARYPLALVAVGVTVSLIGLLRMYLELPTAVLLYLVPIILAATRWGRGPAVVAAAASAVGHDFFFIEPVGTLSIGSADEAVGLVLLLFTALVTAQLAETARHAADREREAAVARRSDDLKSALLRAVTHDLRTPLASIKANVSGLRQAEVAYSDEDRAELLAAIDDEADRLDRLVANLLDASRLEAGVLVPHKQPQDLAELVRAVLVRLRPLLAGREVRLAIAEHLPLVSCDYGQVDQIVTNLLENATRHTPDGTPIEVHLTADGDMARLEVIDHGAGIPVAERERLFGPFERGQTRAPGSGLGLSIARGLAEAHGGRLEVANTPAGGACFSLTLPI
jgi:two-component system sensor histidine kinase KdpD